MFFRSAFALFPIGVYLRLIAVLICIHLRFNDPEFYCLIMPMRRRISVCALYSRHRSARTCSPER